MLPRHRLCCLLPQAPLLSHQLDQQQQQREAAIAPLLERRQLAHLQRTATARLLADIQRQQQALERPGLAALGRRTTI